MLPYYEAETLFRMMDNREQRIKIAEIIFVEYLKLMNHYGLLEPELKHTWKVIMKNA